MPRPYCCRRILGMPGAPLFKPVGIPARALEVVAMTLDELEAIRLTDLEGLYQEEAARRMGVSRATLGRILAAAHRKVADALTGGKALRIEGGPVAAAPRGPFRCRCRSRCNPGPGRAGRPPEEEIE
jgi:uncharacterized protein